MATSNNQINKIIACGDSVTHGYYLENSYYDDNHVVKCNKSYPELVAEELGAILTHLAKPGASNYCIAKQLDHAFTLKPDFIIIGLTTSHRFDYTIDMFPEKYWKDNIPRIVDFAYSNHGKSTETNEKGVIDSQPFSTIERRPELREFADYILKYVDEDIKRDQDRHIVMGMLWKLAKTKIPYVMIDWTNLVLYDYKSPSVIKELNWKEFRDKYPSDGVHFNQEGHEVAARRINSFIKNMKAIHSITAKKQ